MDEFQGLFAAGLGAAIFLYLHAHWRNLMATIADLSTIADKISADLDTKLAAKDAQIADLTTKLAAAEANATDPAAIQAVADKMTAIDAKLA
jgi:hypothetical protein